MAECQADLDEATADVELALEQGSAEGCSPWSPCRSGSPVADDFDVAA
ncbi:hypothetical protein E4N62_18630 [Streptomyces sp. MNU76]|nr:hypothetical protein [Streptomyces sp. MNU76]MCC9707109.1 hypothetical protein [Streptomyces sp. MNU76]